MPKPVKARSEKVTFKQHVSRWRNCDQCELCSRRKRVVLYRGTIPAPVLFVGEAPGNSEDVIGQPFVGDAGQLLDKIIVQSGLGKEHHGFANVIACIPKDESNTKVTDPPKFAIEACKERLAEIIQIARPRAIIWVGAVAKKHGPKSIPATLDFLQCDIIHPAAILRMNISQRGLAAQRCAVKINDVGMELGLVQ